MFHGFDWFGNILEVREDRFAGMGGFRGGRGGFGMGMMGGRGGFGMGRGGFAPGFRGGFGGPGFRGGFRGGRGGFGGGFGGHHGGFGGGHGGPAAAGGRNFSNDLYADYNGPEGGAQNGEQPAAAATAGLRAEPAEPNQQILVRNVSLLSLCHLHLSRDPADTVQLPWSTSNEDLVELFETVGTVSVAEILYDGTRSKGEGIVQFTETAEAQTAGEKFTGYQYGGRPLGTFPHSLLTDCNPTLTGL